MTQKILFPMKYMRITTGVNELSHKGGNDLDNAGKDTGKDDVFAPFTGIIKKIYPVGNTVWLESTEPVQYADGTVDFATAYFTHDSDVSNLKVGQVIQQGQVFYQEGTANATAAHVHLGIGRGKFSNGGWHKTGFKWNGAETWVINNSYIPWDAFFITDDTIILNGNYYPWKKIEEKIMIPDFAHLSALTNAFFEREPQQAEVDRYVGKADYNKVVEDFNDSDEYRVVTARSAAKNQTIATQAERIKQLETQGKDEYVPAGEIFVKKKK